MLLSPGLQLYQGVNWKKAGITNFHVLYNPKYDQQSLKEIASKLSVCKQKKGKILKTEIIYFLVKFSLGLDLWNNHNPLNYTLEADLDLSILKVLPLLKRKPYAPQLIPKHILEIKYVILKYTCHFLFL